MAQPLRTFWEQMPSSSLSWQQTCSCTHAEAGNTPTQEGRECDTWTETVKAAQLCDTAAPLSGLHFPMAPAGAGPSPL